MVEEKKIQSGAILFHLQGTRGWMELPAEYFPSGDGPTPTFTVRLPDICIFESVIHIFFKNSSFLENLL